MARIAAVVLLVLGLLPLANWIPGGHEAPWYRDRLDMWLSGGAILLGAGVICWIALRRYPHLWREGAWSRLAGVWQASDRYADALIAAAAGVLYVTVARVVLSARPLLIDEVIQVWQARVFASGKLFLPVSAHPEFTAAMHLVDTGNKLYGQFPAGGPAMLALGALVDLEWLVGPLFAALGVYCFARMLRRVETRTGTALAAVLLYAFAPFTLFLSGSMMNHVTTTAWLLAAALALVLATRDTAPRTWPAFAAGLCLGIAATIRPLDAMAFALPAAVWLLWRIRLGVRQAAPLLASGIGVALPLAVLLAINAAWTGEPLRFGYIELWGVTHELGFHEAPWGFAHTPARGVELVNLYLLRLQTYFLETPVPALIFATVALLLTRRASACDRWALAGSGLLLLSYFAYWHDGFYLGPRFMLPLAPWLAIWTARLPAVLRERQVAPHVHQAVVTTGVIAVMIGGALLLPIRWAQYRNGMLSMRFDVAGAARAAGVPTGAVILVRETWGSQLIARMWGQGVTRTQAERIYRSTDSCRLDGVLHQVEQQGGGAARVLELVGPLRADSSRLVAQYLSPDTTLRTMPGAMVAGRCARRLEEDRFGTSRYAPLLVESDTQYTFVRDLHARNARLGLMDRDWWLMRQEPAPGSPLQFRPIDTDSMLSEWGMP